MATLADLAAEVAIRVPEVISVFTASVRENAVEEAIDGFATYEVSCIVEDIAGSGVFDLTLPAGFDQDCSMIKQVEYPAGERNPVCLAPDTYILYDDGGGTKVLRLLQDTPETGETVRLTYTLPYTVDTLLEKDEYVVINLACGLYCDWISAYYGASTRSTIGTDSAEHLQQQQSYAERAQRFRDLALEALGIDATAGQPGRERGGSGSGGQGGGLAAAAASTLDWGPSTNLLAYRLTHQGHL